MYLVGGGIALTVLWFLYKKSKAKRKRRIKPKKQPNPDRLTHFLSIRIDNPLIVGLGKQIQVINIYNVFIFHVEIYM